MFRMYASNSHSYTHLIQALGIVRKPTVWVFLTSKYPGTHDIGLPSVRSWEPPTPLALLALPDGSKSSRSGAHIMATKGPQSHKEATKKWVGRPENLYDQCASVVLLSSMRHPPPVSHRLSGPGVITLKSHPQGILVHSSPVQLHAGLQVQ